MSTVEAIYKAKTSRGSSIHVQISSLPLEINRLIVWVLEHPKHADALIPYWRELRKRTPSQPTRTELAHRIASLAARELVECEGLNTGVPDEYTIPRDAMVADQHLQDCVNYLLESGEAAQFDGACDGPDPECVIILLGDFSLSSLAGDDHQAPAFGALA